MECEEITGKIIKAFYKVYNKLGYGFLERVYENALMIEFDELGLRYVNQHPIVVVYRGKVVGNYVSDFFIEDRVVVEIKAIREIGVAEKNQLLNYLTCSDKEVGLLLNFGLKPEFCRKIHSNSLKKKY